MATCRITTSIDTNVKNATVYAVAFGTSQTNNDVKKFVRSRMYNQAFIRNYPDTIVSMYSDTTGTRFHSGKGNDSFRGQLSSRVTTATGYTSPVAATIERFSGGTLVSDTHVYIVLVDGIHKTNISVTKIFTGSLSDYIVDATMTAAFAADGTSMDVSADILNNVAETGNVYYYSMAFTKEPDNTEYVLNTLSLANAVSTPLTIVHNGGGSSVSTETASLATVVDNVNESVFPMSAVNAAYVYAVVSTANVA